VFSPFVEGLLAEMMQAAEDLVLLLLSMMILHIIEGKSAVPSWNPGSARLPGYEDGWYYYTIHSYRYIDVIWREDLSPSCFKYFKSNQIATLFTTFP
jgi:hypothetical protein